MRRKNHLCFNFSGPISLQMNNQQQDEEAADEWDREGLLDPEWEIQQKKVYSLVTFRVVKFYFANRSG